MYVYRFLTSNLQNFLSPLILLTLWEQLFIPKCSQNSPTNLKNSPKRRYVGWRDLWLLKTWPRFCVKTIICSQNTAFRLTPAQWEPSRHDTTWHTEFQLQAIGPCYFELNFPNLKIFPLDLPIIHLLCRTIFRFPCEFKIAGSTPLWPVSLRCLLSYVGVTCLTLYLLWLRKCPWKNYGWGNLYKRGQMWNV